MDKTNLLRFLAYINKSIKCAIMPLLSNAIINVLLFAFILLPIHVAKSQDNQSNNPIQILYSGQDIIDTEPKTIITCAFFVNNLSHQSISLESEIRLPSNWAIITGESTFELSPGEGDIQLVTFHVSQSALAGKYELVYIVRDRKKYSLSNSHAITINVLPITKLSIGKTEAPEYVIAGESYRLFFIIKNDGNTLVTVDINATSDNRLPYIVDVTKMRLSPGEARPVKVTIKTDADLNATIKHKVTLKAVVSWKKQSEVEASSHVNIISRTPKHEDLFIRYPITMSSLGYFGKSEIGSDNDYSYQFELSGEGAINRENTRQLDFTIRAPNNRGNIGLGNYDEYSLRFNTKPFSVAVGDNNYTLSELTGNYNYGRGAKGILRYDGLSFMAYHQRSRWTKSGISGTAGQLNYDIAQKGNISLNYLRKTGYNDSGITSLSGYISPGLKTIINAEYALGKKYDNYNYAYQIKVYGQPKIFQYDIKYMHAEPDYLGYYKDIDSFYARSSIKIMPKLELYGGGILAKNNIKLNPKFSARQDKSHQLGLMYQPFKIFGFRVIYDYNRTKDIMQAKFDYLTHNFKVNTEHGIKGFDFQASYEHKKSLNKLSNSVYESDIYGFSGYYNRYGIFNFGIDIGYENSITPDETKFRNMQNIISVSIKPTKKTPISISVYNYHYMNKGFDDQTSLYGEFEYLITENHIFSLQSHNNFRKNWGSNNIILQYTARIGMPIIKKRSVGKVKGTIYYDETKKPIPDAIITLEGIPAVSNKKGEFEFPLIATGAYNLAVNTNRVGPNLIFSKDTPEKVLVADGEQTIIKVGLARGSKVFGKIMVYTFKESETKFGSSPNEENLIEAYGLPNAILEISDGVKKKMRFTDENGYFIFEGLHSGKWTLKLLSYDIPDYYYIEQDSFDIFLFPNDKTERIFKVLPKRRVIRIIEEGKTIQEE